VLLCGLNDLRKILLNLVCIYVYVHCLFRSESYTTEVVNSYFHLYRCGYPYNRIDFDALTTGLVDLINDVIA
jgi:hypothetical protein